MGTNLNHHMPDKNNEFILLRISKKANNYFYPNKLHISHNLILYHVKKKLK